MFKKDGFGSSLSQTRKAHKLSQLDFIAQLASAHKEFSDITQTTLSLWENGRREPSLLRRIAIARCHAVDYDMTAQEQRLIEKTKTINLGHRPSFYPITMSGIISVRFADLTDK